MLEVLQSQDQFKRARRALEKSGRSALGVRALRWLRARHLAPGLPVGEFNKSWDVANTLQLIDQRLPRSAPVLDLGAYCSEVPVALAQMGFTSVHGIDLNPAVRKMPMADKVEYVVGDFNQMPFPDNSFDAITAISVIEHGYEPARIFSEIGRLLRPGGFFIASFDYWPTKIDTRGVKFFDLSWVIFSFGDFRAMLETAAQHGLQPLGEIHGDAGAPTVKCGGFNYTFAWTVLQKV